LEVFTLIAIIALSSLVQSVFGVGILLFGTPTLLLLGYSYSETLCIVLPSSLSISLAQVFSCRQLVEAERDVYLLALPSVLISLIIVLNFEELWDITKIVGLFLLMVGLIRVSKKSKMFLDRIISKRPKCIYVLTGLIHGLSNMGGGPLSVLMASIHKDKIAIRTNIAFVYFWFSLIQLAALAAFSLDSFKYYYFLFPFLSLLIYNLFNKILMEKIDEEKFQIIVTIIIILYGSIALFKP